MSGPQTLRELRAWAEAAPRGATVPVASLAELLADLEDETGPSGPGPGEPSEPVSRSWRERIWDCPSGTRLGVCELSEALGRPPSWIYRRTGPQSTDRLPHRKLSGSLTFTAGELRAWLREHEEVIEAGPYESTSAERRLRAM